MVKPQFEVGKDRVGKGGVVRDLGLRAEAVVAVAQAAADRGWGARAVTTSPLPGPSGNVEFFLWLAQGPPRITSEDIEAEVARGRHGPGVPGEKVDA
jgi:23S rRNA (cytidine1920-2'-O)/16S rRNA (cytidine1409-2'-O)-methyltransferase